MYGGREGQSEDTANNCSEIHHRDVLKSEDITDNCPETVADM